MSLASTCRYLEECRDELSEGSPRTALVALKEALERLAEDAPFTWQTNPAKGAVKDRVKNWAKKKVSDYSGSTAKLHKAANDAHAHGQQVAAFSAEAHKKAAVLAKKGDVQGATAHRQAAIKATQTAMQRYHDVSQAAQKQGNTDISTWAARSGARATADRSSHMSAAKNLSQPGQHTQPQSHVQPQNHAQAQTHEPEPQGRPEPQAAPKAPKIRKPAQSLGASPTKKKRPSLGSQFNSAKSAVKNTFGVG